MFRRPAEFRFPDSPARLYPASPDGPWHLEVGFGDGRFWVAQREAEPGANYLGVEVSGASVLRALRRLRSAGVERAILARSSAEFAVRNIVPQRALARVYVNFPDPWPKARHAEARLLRPEFLELLSTRLAPDGELWLTTDHLGYFEFALASANATGLYDLTQPEPPAAALGTKYASKWQDMGLAIHHARFRSRAVSPRAFAPMEVFTVPHALLAGRLDPPPLEKRVLQARSYTVILLESLARPGRVAVLARVEEPDLTQSVLVSAHARENGEVVVGVESFGDPLITAGVKAAVGAVADWLAETGLEVRRRSY